MYYNIMEFLTKHSEMIFKKILRDYWILAKREENDNHNKKRKCAKLYNNLQWQKWIEFT